MKIGKSIINAVDITCYDIYRNRLVDNIKCQAIDHIWRKIHSNVNFYEIVIKMRSNLYENWQIYK